MADPEHRYRGACECGAVRYLYMTSRPLQAWQPRACQCEYCLPRAASYLAEADAVLEVEVKDRRYLYAHTFATGSAEFMHCAVCNELVYVTSVVAGREYALAVAAVLEAAPELPVAIPMDFDDEDVAERLQRRARSWIPSLRLVETRPRD